MQRADHAAGGRRRAVSVGLAVALALSFLVAFLWLSHPGEQGQGPVGGGTPADAAPVAPKPNVVVIMTDDQTVADMRVMPQTRRLIGGAGVTFDRSYISWPVCCPSRATYLTGQYAHNHGVRGLYPPSGGYGRLHKQDTLPVWLDRAGYRTVHIGKFLNGYGRGDPTEVPPGWDDWHGSVDPTTYRMFGYTLNENGRLYTYGSLHGHSDPRLYQTDVYAQKAVDAIEGNRRRRTPLFLSVAFLAPHHEADGIREERGRSVRPAPRHDGLLAHERLPRPPGFDERDLSDKPSFLRDRAPLLDGATIAKIGRNYRSRQESLLAVDEAVARIVGALRTTGQLDNTYLLFTSDNGFLQGEHRLPSGKLLAYEPSSAVPLLIRGPGLPRGRRSSELVANTDIAPTIAELGRATPGHPFDGRSLLPFARDPARHSDRPLLHETGGLANVASPDADGGPVRVQRTLTYRAVRTRRYLYIEHRDGARELYDHRVDPYELDSRHADPRYRQTRAALAATVDTLARCRGVACTRDAEPIPAPTS